MKKIILMSILSLVLVFPSSASAKVVIEEQGAYTLPAGETLDDDLFVGSQSVTILGNVNGSIFAGAGTISISGKVGGDIIAGTGDLTLTKAQVTGNVIVGAGKVMIDDASKIGGSLIAGSGTLHNLAPVGRNVMVGAGTAYISSTIGKELRFGGRDLELGPKTKIAGNLTYALDQETGMLKQDPSATIAGSVSRYTPPESARRDMDKAREDFGKFGRVAHTGWLMVSFIGSLLLGFLLLKLFPKTGLGVSGQISKSLIPSVGVGFLVVVLSVPVLFVLALTVIGLPLVGLLIPLLFIELHLAKLISSYALGRFMARQFNWGNMGVYAVFTLGLIIFYLLRAVPGIGWITSVLFTWTGLGAIWLYTRSNLKSL